MPTIVSPTSSTTWKGSANIIWNKRVFWCSYLWNYFYSPTYSQTQEFTSPFISSPPIHSMAPDRTHSSLHLYNFRSTALSVLLTSPPSYHSPMLPTSTTPLFSYRSLFLQAGNSYIHFYVSVHVNPLHSCFLPTFTLILCGSLWTGLSAEIPTKNVLSKARQWLSLPSEESSFMLVKTWFI